DDFVVSVKPRLQLFDALEIDHGGAVDAEEFIRMKPGFEIVHGIAQQMHITADMEAQIVAGGFNPVDFLGAQEKDAPARLDHQPVQELSPGSSRLGAIQENA